MPNRTAIYARVSTDGQTTANQKNELMAVIAQRGWENGKIYEDEGISGAKGRDKRPALDQMLKDAVRARMDIVAVWSIDRLGRSLKELLAILEELQSSNVQLYCHQQALDTTTPAGKAMFQMIGVFAEFERSMIQDRVKAGLERARAEGKRLGAQPKVSNDVRDEIRFELEMGTGVSELAHRHNLSRMTIYRIRDESPVRKGG